MANRKMDLPENLRSNPEEIWIKSSQIPDIQNRSCKKGTHIWIAQFLQSGRLACWRCESCGREEKEIDPFTEPFEIFSGWIDDPLKLISIGSNPPKSDKSWSTDRETVLVEKEPSTIHHMGLQIPEITSAHTYIEYDDKGKVQKIFEPEKQRHSLYGDHYTLIRYQVVEKKLIKYTSHCFEDSMYEIPNTSKPEESVVLSGLKLLRNK